MEKQEFSNSIPQLDVETILSTPQEYIKGRVEDQIKWLFAKSAQNRKRYFQLRVMQIGLSISLPALIGIRAILDTNSYAQSLSAVSLIISVGILLLEMVNSNFRYYEFWLEYRSLGSSLERELYLYTTRSGPYQIETPTLFNDFVLTAERIIWNSSQNSK